MGEKIIIEGVEETPLPEEKGKKYSTAGLWLSILEILMFLMVLLFYFVPFIKIEALGGKGILSGFTLAFGGTLYISSSGSTLEPIITSYPVNSLPGLTVAHTFTVAAFAIFVVGFIIRLTGKSKAYCFMNIMAALFTIVAAVLLFCCQPMYEATNDVVIKAISGFKCSGNFLVGAVAIVSACLDTILAFIK